MNGAQVYIKLFDQKFRAAFKHEMIMKGLLVFSGINLLLGDRQIISFVFTSKKDSVIKVH